MMIFLYGLTAAWLVVMPPIFICCLAALQEESTASAAMWIVSLLPSGPL
jgi:hypothetical protein